jgi:HNH endonuclease
MNKIGRQHLIEWAFGHKCAYCGGGAGSIAFPLTVDHVVPLAKGGFKGMLNCVPACRTCNSLKGNLNLGAFLAKYRIGSFEDRCRLAQKRLQDRLSGPDGSKDELEYMQEWQPIRGLSVAELPGFVIKELDRQRKADLKGVQRAARRRRAAARKISETDEIACWYVPDRKRDGE